MAPFRFVRLNATMYPAGELEQSLYAKFDIEPEYVEEEDPQELIRRLATCDAVAVVSTGLPAAVVASLDRCRLISRLGNGTDKIAVEKATECGIIVSNAPFFCAEEMTDHIMAMLLSLARQLPRMEQFMRAAASAKPVPSPPSCSGSPPVRWASSVSEPPARWSPAVLGPLASGS